MAKFKMRTLSSILAIATISCELNATPTSNYGSFDCTPIVTIVCGDENCEYYDDKTNIGFGENLGRLVFCKNIDRGVRTGCSVHDLRTSKTKNAIFAKNPDGTVTIRINDKYNFVFIRDNADGLLIAKGVCKLAGPMMNLRPK